ncbi:MAG: SurA N-terminal domain-containing protein [Acidovorax sp.]
MFESIRKHNKLLMALLFLLTIPSFILMGVDHNYFSEKSPAVASVDGHDITQADWDNTHRTEMDRIRAQSPNVDAKLLDSPASRYATLDKMVRERVLAAAAQKMHLIASDARLAGALQQIPAIAALKRPDGTLDAAAYKALVATQGLTPEGFEASVRRDLSINQVLGGVAQSAFSTDAQFKQAMDALYQRRDIQVARFNPQDFTAKVTPTDDELQAFYKTHTASFQQPEEATVQYLVLDLDAVRSGISVSDDDLRTYYNENKDRLAGKEERRASHILINAPKDMPAADRAKAKAHAEELLAQVRKNPASFADVAKKNSQDVGSAPSGGDLGFFGRGAMVKPFEDAVFGMKKGDISDLVESDFGYHIIQLTDVKQPPVPSFEDARAKLTAELQQQQAQRKFAEVAENFSNGVYEQSDSLQPTADKLKLKIQTAEHVTRTPAPGAKGPLANARFLEALFSSDAIEKKRNTEAIEIGPSLMAAGRIAQYQPARTLPYDEVKAKVREQYVADKAAELARADGAAKLAAWKAAPASATGLSPAATISRDQPQNLPGPVLDAALHASTDNLPTWTGVDLGAQGYAIIKLNSVLPRATPEAQMASAQKQQFQQLLGVAEGMAYYDLLKERFKVQIKVPRPSASAQ